MPAWLILVVVVVGLAVVVWSVVTIASALRPPGSEERVAARESPSPEGAALEELRGELDRLRQRVEELEGRSP